MQDELIFSPSEFVALFNQTMELAYPTVVVEGELSGFRVSKNRWLYFNLQDDSASVAFFGSVYALPGPLEDGLKIRVTGQPRLHQRFGFSINVMNITPVGQGSIKKAADLLAKKLAAEGLFAAERKRFLPTIPQTIGLITAADSAAAADFIKITNERWGGVEIQLHDAYVQGDQAPASLVSAIDYFNRSANPPDILVLTRGGGSAEDLAAFSDERVVRAVAASRVPTIVAIGHEVDISLAELAADQRASTPTNAAAMAVPDRRQELAIIKGHKDYLRGKLIHSHQNARAQVKDLGARIAHLLDHLIDSEKVRLKVQRQLLVSYDPKSALKRGYAIISRSGKHVSRAAQLKRGDALGLEFSDGTINATVTGK